jgi:hypothetical protein
VNPFFGLALFVAVLAALFIVGLLRRRELARFALGSAPCPQCGALPREPPRLSVFGFVGARCSACGLRVREPLSQGVRSFYALLGLLALASMVRGRFSVLAALYVVIVTTVLALDWQAVRERKRGAGGAP